MFIVSEIKLIKESGVWAEDTMCENNSAEFETFEDAQNYYDNINPKDIYTTEKYAGPHFGAAFGFGVQLAEEIECGDSFIMMNIIAEKQYTSDDDADLD